MRLMPALIVLLLALTACAAPAPNGSAATQATPPASSTPTSPAPPSDDGEYPRPKPALPSREPLPPTDSARSITVDYSCKTNADCAVKNVGNCCGYYPACVNVNSPTDPQAVQAECAKKGMMSVCGFPDISACTCSQGRCKAASGNAQVQ